MVRHLPVALLLTGCFASDPDYSLALNVDVPGEDPELVAAALSASARVYAASGVRVYVDAPDAPDVERYAAIVWGDPHGDASGTYDAKAGTLTIDFASPSWAVPTVVLHELLHALGSGHCHGALSPDFPGAGALLTAEALAELCAGGAPCRWMRPETAPEHATFNP
jgi:hypothetical protein